MSIRLVARRRETIEQLGPIQIALLAQMSKPFIMKAALFRWNRKTSLSEIIATGFDINSRETHGLTPLSAAILRNDTTGLTLLVPGSMADLNVVDRKGRTLLHCAAASASMAFAQRLIELG